MAKKKQPRQTVDQIYTSGSVKVIRNDKQTIVVTSLGRELPLKPVSPYLIEAIESGVQKEWIKEFGALPTVPTYEIEVDGNTIQMDHDLTTLDDTDDEDEATANRVAWDKYQSDMNLLRARRTQRITKALILRGCDIQIPEDDAWYQEQKALGADIPENTEADPQALRFYYIVSEYIGSTKDLLSLIEIIMSFISVDEEDVESQMSKFPGELQGAEHRSVEVEDGGKLEVE